MFVIHCASLAFVSEKFQGRQEIHKHRRRNAGSQGTASVAVSGEPGEWEVFALSWPWQITRGWWHGALPFTARAVPACTALLGAPFSARCCILLP